MLYTLCEMADEGKFSYILRMPAHSGLSTLRPGVWDKSWDVPVAGTPHGPRHANTCRRNE